MFTFGLVSSGTGTGTTVIGGDLTADTTNTIETTVDRVLSSDVANNVIISNVENTLSANVAVQALTVEI